MKISNLKNIFSTDKHGYSLNSIYDLNNSYSFNSSILILIETKEKGLIGGVFSNLLKFTNDKYVRPLHSQLCLIRPKIQVFKPMNNSDDILYCSHEYIMIGGGPNGPAIMIDQDLKKGFSNDENYFKFPIFNPESKGMFEIVRIEIYMFQ